MPDEDVPGSAGTGGMVSVDVDLAGKTLGGRFRLEREIGRGSMGVIYQSVQIGLGAVRAVKVLAPHLVWNARHVQRFLQEARIPAMLLKHPGIVPVIDVGQEGQWHYIVMDFVDGESLDQLIRRDGRMQPVQAAAIIAQVADALDYAHRAGVYHCDVKPGNIMLDRDGRARLLDFGLVTMASDERATRDGGIIGTPAYMSPEQVSRVPAENLTPASDTYSLGIVAYELLTGQVPFDADSTAALLRAQRDQAPPPPSRVNGDLEPAIERVLLQVLAKNPAQRFDRAGAFAAALVEAAAGPDAAPLPAPGPWRRVVDRVPPALMPVAVAGGAVVTLATVAMGMQAVIDRPIRDARATQTAVMSELQVVEARLTEGLIAADDAEATRAAATAVAASLTRTAEVARVTPTRTSTPEPPATGTPVIPTRTPTQLTKPASPTPRPAQGVGLMQPGAGAVVTSCQVTFSWQSPSAAAAEWELQVCAEAAAGVGCAPRYGVWSGSATSLAWEPGKPAEHVNNQDLDGGAGVYRWRVLPRGDPEAAAPVAWFTWQGGTCGGSASGADDDDGSGANPSDPGGGKGEIGVRPER